MARFTDPVCKRCRREQMKLYLKGARCFSPKCPIDREAPPAAATEMVRWVVEHRRDEVLGIGIDYREVDHPPEDFVDASALDAARYSSPRRRSVKRSSFFTVYVIGTQRPKYASRKACQPA